MYLKTKSVVRKSGPVLIAYSMHAIMHKYPVCEYTVRINYNAILSKKVYICLVVNNAPKIIVYSTYNVSRSGRGRITWLTINL